MDKEKLEATLEVIKDAIEKEVTAGDIAGATQKLLELSSLMGTAAECMKWAKKLILDAQGAAAKKHKDGGGNANTIKLMIESEIAEELMIFLYADRLCAALTHVVDALRTTISLYKSELEKSKFQS